MDRMANELADLADGDFDRIAAVVDATTGVLPEALTAWGRHLVDQERDGQAGNLYPAPCLASLCGPSYTFGRRSPSRRVWRISPESGCIMKRQCFQDRSCDPSFAIVVICL